MTSDAITWRNAITYSQFSVYVYKLIIYIIAELKYCVEKRIRMRRKNVRLKKNSDDVLENVSYHI